MYTYVLGSMHARVHTPFSHDVDVANIQEAKVHVGVDFVIFVPTTHGLHRKRVGQRPCMVLQIITKELVSQTAITTRTLIRTYILILLWANMLML